MAKRKNDSRYIYILFGLVLGMLLGWTGFDFKTTGSIGAIMDNMGIWIMAISLLAFLAEQALTGGIACFTFTAGRYLSLFIRSGLQGNRVPSNLYIYALITSLIAGLLGFVIWHARERKWTGALCGSFPISLLLCEGYPIIYSRSVSLGFDIVCAIILYFILLKGTERKVRAIPFILIFLFVLIYFDMYSKIAGVF